MSQLVESLEQIVADLRDSDRPWALVGGLAVSARSEPRTTRDVDVAVAVATDPEAEWLTTHLLRRGYILQTAVEQTATGRLATVRLLPPNTDEFGAIVDLLFASCGIEPDIVERADELEIIRRITAPVARVGDLIAMKILSRDDDTRPQDAADLRALLRVATEDEVRIAREAVAAIRHRGFHRDRDLDTLLDDALRRWRP